MAVIKFEGVVFKPKSFQIQITLVCLQEIPLIFDILKMF